MSHERLERSAGLQSRRNPSRSPASSPATPRSARSAAAATTCTIAATTSSSSPTHCEFEEIALPAGPRQAAERAELAAYKAKLKSLRGLPAAVRTVLEALPAATHPMDVLRTGVSALGCALPEKDDHNAAGARDIADRLHRVARLDAALLVSLQPLRPAHRRRDGRRLDRRALPAPAARRAPSASWVRAMHTSLILYAEHEFNASTFTARVIAGTGLGHVLRASPAPSARCAARSTAARTRWRSRSRALRHAGRSRGGHPRARGAARK